MPETHFTLRWPDGEQMVCYSPSSVIEQHFCPGACYPLEEFRERARGALLAASERVRALYGFPCSRALGQLAQIEHRAADFTAYPDARVEVVGFQR